MRRSFGGEPGGPDIEVRLSNPDKVLYPATGTTKGEVLEYYAEIAPAMLPHMAGRPVTRKRWPDGVGASSFFEKNLAAGTPSWVPRRTQRHSDRPVTYPVISSQAGLVWLGQQAALEIHVPQWRFDGDERGPATRLVFDLDPGPGTGLPECARVALGIRDMVGEIGMRAYPLTSGSKGIHLYVPLDRTLGPGGASTVAKQVAENLEKLLPDLVTATMAKKVRAGKVFLDWSQNNPAKTTIAPYSLRGREEPNAAAPRSWNEIEDGTALRQLRFDEVLRRYRSDGDLLAGLDPPLDDTLTKYRSMRDPARTPEPVPAEAPRSGTGDRFVIHEHHARRLHWDVRLEREGVLVSWAVPKGPPDSPRQNRLAVHTEDHPLEYLDFHGTIPSGEYGAGEMSVWDTGTYQAEKWRDDEVIVVLRGTRLNGRYALIRTEGDQWLMHLMKDRPAPAGDLPRGLAPMLATSGDVSALPESEWVFERKWDGFRLIVEVEAGELRLRSRTGNDVTAQYPQLAELAADLDGHQVVLDGEIIVRDPDGAVNVALLKANPRRAEFVAFDLLYLDGTSLLRKRYRDRRRVLEALAATAPALRVPPPYEGSGADAVRQSEQDGVEGVVAKKGDSVYLPGTRGRTWVKQRNWRTRQVVVGGMRRSRARPFASLLVGIPAEDGLVYAGRVGTGFGDAGMRELAARLHRLERKTSPFVNEMSADERRDALWVTPKVEGTVRYMDWTEAGRLWHPAWLGEL
ncbi:ATP-dependent DNA ligase [Nocardia zapadnayensis]|uniref:ATP-dependent DNA ligase n=1 Tax=Nocardia rhamnosiphila TaxID=426716 RepID=UPI0022463283|nr:ATP-dependent DNA ligase [Nocardia zapadnayensis]MCX0269702.1 ATP-dependent DNA ligase [Nocardia zapadnayensis]